MGVEVAPVILLDTDPPLRPDDRATQHAASARLLKFVRILNRSAATPLAINMRELTDLSPARQAESLLRAMQGARLLPKRANVALVRGILRVFEANLRTEYRPDSPLDCPVYLLQTGDVDLDDPDSIPPEEVGRRWRAFAPDLREFAVTGNHITMLQRENIALTARVIRQAWGWE